MADQQYFINKDKYDALKQQMNYEQVVTTLPADKRIILDWLNLLTSFKDDENRQWAISHPSTSMIQNYGELSANLTSGEERININILSFSQGQKTAIDSALRKATNTNAPFIAYRFQDKCMGDFCLVPSIMDHVNFVKFVYGNILVELDHSNSEKEVLSVARYIQAAMEKAVAANPQQQLPARPIFTYKTEPSRQKIGGTFNVGITPNYQRDLWRLDVARSSLSSNIEYERNMGHNTYKFSVKSAGEGRVAFNLMDRKTLWVFTDTVMIDID